MADEFPAGSVWLVGAGPGDPDLLTRKAERLLRTATIVFYDALVGEGVLALVPASVRRVPVGKRAGRHSKEQGTINELLVAAAQAGERVVRLKGGDPSIFGRSMEECSALGQAGVPVRICPGITAASAAAASAGVSLSLRGLARRVQFATAHKRGDAPLDLDWAALADPHCTTVFYMGRSAAAEISRNLTAAGLSGATPVLVACDVSLASERLLHTRLDLLHIAISAFSNDQPTLILVGEALAVGGRMQIAGSGVRSLCDGLPQSTSALGKLNMSPTIFRGQQRLPSEEEARLHHLELGAARIDHSLPSLAAVVSRVQKKFYCRSS